MTASYSGDAHNQATTSAPVIVTVNPAQVLMVPVCGPSSLVSGNSYGCIAALVYDLGLVNGTLTYSLDGAPTVQVPVDFGLALFAINKPSVGTHHLVINFPAQGNFAAAAPQTETFTVTKSK